MAYDQLLSDSWQLIRRYKFLFWLGMLVVAWGRLGEAYLRLGWPQRLARPQDLLTWDGTLPPWRTIAIWTAALFTAVLLTWLVGVIAEGGLITTAAQLDGEPVTGLRQALGSGWRLLGRLVAVDTILLLPLFLLSLLLLLLPAGTLAGSALRLEGGATAVEVLLMLGSGLLITLLLTALALPVVLLTMLLRVLAFRAIAVTGLGVRAAVRRAAGMLRRRWRPILLIGLFLTVLRYGTAILLAVITGVVTIWAGGSAGIIAGVALLATAVHALVHTFSSTVWTLAYRQFEG